MMHDDNMDMEEFYKRIEEEGQLRDLEDINRWKAPEVQSILAELILAFNMQENWRSIYMKLPFVDAYDEGYDLRGAPLVGLDVSDRDFDNLKFDLANMENSRFTDCYFTNCDFNHANLMQSTLANCHFKGCLLIDTNFENANLTNSSFSDVTLSGSNLKNANFINVNFGGTLITGCNLTNTIFTNADFAHTTIAKSPEDVNPRLEAMHKLMLSSESVLQIDDLRKILKRLEGETHNLFTTDELETWVKLYHHFQDKLYDAYHQAR